MKITIVVDDHGAGLQIGSTDSPSAITPDNAPALSAGAAPGSPDGTNAPGASATTRTATTATSTAAPLSAGPAPVR